LSCPKKFSGIKVFSEKMAMKIFRLSYDCDGANFKLFNKKRFNKYKSEEMIGTNTNYNCGLKILSKLRENID